MCPARDAVSRWLRLAVAALAMLAGSGVHEALHASDHRADGRPLSPFEAHGAGCEHLGDELPHDAACLMCKVGGPHAFAPQAHRNGWEPPRSLGRLDEDSTAGALAASIPGSLGARAPPVTVG